MRISTNMLYQSSISEVNSLQASILRLTQQTTQGKVLNPADDPVASARALDLSQTQALNDQYKTNRQNATSSLAQVSSTLTSVTSLLTDIHSSVVNAGNASYSNSDRLTLANQVTANMQQMMGYANTTDGLGNFLFSGYKSTTTPFVTDSTGAVQYQGDQGSQTLQVDSTRQMAVTTSGQSIFQANGQDTFKTINSLIKVLSTPVTAAANSADAAAAAALPTAVTYQTAQAAVDAKDPADLTVPTYDTLFSQAATAKAAADLAEAARTPVAGSNTALTRALGKIGTSLDALSTSVSAVTAGVGSNQKELATLDEVGSAKAIQYQATVNNLMGLNPSDLTDTVSQLSLQQTYLQAAQKAFTTTSSLTLLNFLK
ncbi:flagellar hook-associated protein FlgL [Herbaspirillum sp. RTI4]|uniref:flagellar hook-associated protein FlgL n=1 Tax=Herbaspirillum sp. RTI4 TaxID=3048640 RepID=UPI002AB4D5A1|nr:flagellar hook-associated protein FlgL [Herbaspirillum sp. RTI4]MDY7578306.1 flagellar hook-associated protein FlgL [Herbaspirillum sp. RTI4]MEA9981201.1 flagellar hook-associated protein FlgL [Herbaspirillum sp. RTI4]